MAVNIETLKVERMKGRVSSRSLKMVLDWATFHREELERAWNDIPKVPPPNPFHLFLEADPD